MMDSDSNCKGSANRAECKTKTKVFVFIPEASPTIGMTKVIFYSHLVPFVAISLQPPSTLFYIVYMRKICKKLKKVTRKFGDEEK
jgi:hypothetical protein